MVVVVVVVDDGVAPVVVVVVVDDGCVAPVVVVVVVVVVVDVDNCVAPDVVVVVVVVDDGCVATVGSAKSSKDTANNNEALMLKDTTLQVLDLSGTRLSGTDKGRTPEEENERENGHGMCKNPLNLR